MPAYDNTSVAAKLELVAALLEIQGADKFRFLSYRKAAAAVRTWPEQVAALANEGRLTEIPGVGAKMAANIEQIVRSGTFDTLDATSEKTPPSLAEVMKVSGVGPRRAALLHEKLGIATLEDLARELDAGRVATVGGFGAKTAQRIAAGLDAHLRHRARTPIGQALPTAEAFAGEVARLDGVENVQLAGGVRRREETVGNVDVVVAAGNTARVASLVGGLSAVEREVERDAECVRLELHDGLEVRVHLTVPESFGAALRYYTGSIAHNHQLDQLADEVGIDVGPAAKFTAEDEVYSALGLNTPAAELRWGADELDLARQGALPALIDLTDVRGDFQSHSTYTDGKNTLAENRAVAAQLGYEYLAATDHAYALRMVGGLSVEEIRRQHEEIEEINESPGPRLLKGIELNIGPSGELDYDDDVLATFDIVLASLHSGWDESEGTATARVLKAIEHPLVDVIAHPTGRVIGRRDPIRLDVGVMLEAAGATGTIMEINSYPDRLDLSAEHIRLARGYGVRFSLGTDAHASEQLRYMPYGVGQARRGMVVPGEMLNAQPWDIARTWLKRHRTLR